MKKMQIILACISFLIYSGLYAQPNTVFVKKCSPGEDATPFVVEAIKKCKAVKAAKLVFEKGTYEFQPDFASEKYFFVSNNDEGLKRFVFDLSGMKNLEIDGQGSSFVFEGYVTPFLLDNSRKINIKNFTIDYKRTFHSEGKIVAAYQDSLDISFSSDYPYMVNNNKLMFTGGQTAGKDNAGAPRLINYPFWHLLEFDSLKREPAPSANDYLNVQNMIVKELKQGVVRIFYPKLKGTVGNTMIFNAAERTVPGFIVSKSEDVNLTNVTIYHAGSMGVIAQQSKNILLDKVNVLAPPGRMVSLPSDATHFVNCSGKITMQNCVFESQMDDATNIHGIYVKIIKIISPSEVIVKLVHYMQFGFDFLVPGRNVEIVNSESLITYDENSVKKSERMNKEYTKVIFNKPLSDKVKVGDVIASTDQNPEVLIRNCKIQKNRARGFLLGSRGKTVIENNYFHTHAHAIEMGGDGRFWFEQGGVRDVTIRNNIFDNCNYSSIWGVGVISAEPGIEEKSRDNIRYNRNIVIEKNTFRIFNPGILRMYSVDNLKFINNKIEKTTDYTLREWFQKKELKPFTVTNSANIKIKE